MILNHQRAVRLSLPPLVNFLRRVRRELHLDGSEISVCFVTDAEIARLNRIFRRKNKPTDVLTFPAAKMHGKVTRRGTHAGMTPFLSSTSSTSLFLGDIAISPSVARRNARRFGRALSDELRILILHGVLHLLGYDHESDSGEMVRLERRLHRRLGLED